MTLEPLFLGMEQGNVNNVNKKLGIIIESSEIADAMKKIYELAWIGAKEECKIKQRAIKS